MHLGNSGRGPRRGPWGMPDALRCAGEGERAPRTPPRVSEVRFAVPDTRRVATTRRPRPAMPCGVVDLSPLIKEALSGVPFVQVGPDCTLNPFCGHAPLDARRSPRRLRGASFAADGVAHRDAGLRYRPACAASAGEAWACGIRRRTRSQGLAAAADTRAGGAYRLPLAPPSRRQRAASVVRKRTASSPQRAVIWSGAALVAHLAS